jgi:hypothetical protein
MFLKHNMVTLNHILVLKLIIVLFIEGYLLLLLFDRVLKTQAYLMVQKINSGSLFDAKFYIAIGRKG